MFAHFAFVFTLTFDVMLTDAAPAYSPRKTSPPVAVGNGGGAHQGGLTYPTLRLHYAPQSPAAGSPTSLTGEVGPGGDAAGSPTEGGAAAAVPDPSRRPIRSAMKASRRAFPDCTRAFFFHIHRARFSFAFVGQQRLSNLQVFMTWIDLIGKFAAQGTYYNAIDIPIMCACWVDL